MNHPTSQPMADVRDMYMVHTFMDREFGLLPRLVRDVAPGDTARAEVVGSHAALLCAILHMHHEGEDLHLWPRLQERAAARAAAIVPRMEAQHQAIDAATTTVLALLPPWRRTARDGGELADALEQLRTVLVEHMALEEQEILPLAESHLTAAEWKLLGEHGMRATPKKHLPLAFGMAMYEADPDVVRTVLADAPLPARLLMPIIGPRAYAAHAKRVHGTATPPTAGRRHP